MDCWNLSLKSTGMSPTLAMKRTRRSLQELLLFLLFLPPRRAGRGRSIRGPAPFSQNLLRQLRGAGQPHVLQLLPPPLFFLFLTLQTGLAQQELHESRVVHLTTAEVRKRRQTCGARACRTLHNQLRRPRILKDSWPPSTCSGVLLSPWGVVRHEPLATLRQSGGRLTPELRQCSVVRDATTNGVAAPCDAEHCRSRRRLRVQQPWLPSARDQDARLAHCCCQP